VRRALCIPLAAAALAFAAAGAQAETPPTVTGSWPADVGTDSVNLRAQIEAGGLPTTYLFEYTTEAQFRAKGFIGAEKQPQLGVSIGTGSVQQHIGGLEADTAYRFRVVATNNLGFKIGPLRSFKTDESEPVFSLPDSRGWEMVSPADKNGGEIQGFGENHGGGVIQAAAQGSAITYTSASSFAGGAGAPGPSQYLSTRGDGPQWAAQNITLPMLSGTYPESPTAGVPYQLFSTGLDSALVSNGRRCRTSASSQCPVENAPLAGSGAPAGYRNYYLRNNSDGSFAALLTSAGIATLPLGPEDFEVAFAGATPDLARVILSSCAALTTDATEVPAGNGECDPAKQNLYEKTAGSAPRLINLLPAASTGTPGAGLAAQSRAVSADGSRVYWTDGTNLYLREGALTKQVDQSQGGGGTFETASLDGSIAYFSKAGRLYRYSATSGTAGELTLTPKAGLQGVLGSSEDGTWVYYLTSAGLYLDHNGTVTLVSPQAEAASAPPATGTARISADGRHLLFVSEAELSPYDNRNLAGNSPEPEVYLFTAPGAAGAGIICASCNPSGERPTGPASLPGAEPNGSGPNAPRAYKPRVLSADSKRVFFDTFDALAVGDTNNDRDVYEWEAAGSGDCTRPSGCVKLISSGRAEGGAGFLDASADGSDAFFLTDGSLVSSDPAERDVYDARVNGGSAGLAPAIPCFGDACQALPPEPEDPGTGTRRSKPSGNLTALASKALHCKKGQVKKLGKCVKKKTRHPKSKKTDHKKSGGHK
jgi:hypothetical protein